MKLKTTLSQFSDYFYVVMSEIIGDTVANLPIALIVSVSHDVQMSR